MIYVILKGRIGNQLFMFSIAKHIQKAILKKSKIIIDDKEVLKENWTNDLNYYSNIKSNTTFVHNHKLLISKKFIVPTIALIIYKIMVHKKDYMTKYAIEKKYQNFFNFFGLIICENGYLPYKVKRKNVLIYGYFQSERYFKDSYQDIITSLSLKNDPNLLSYPNINKIKSRNTVCISIKVEHNVGNEIYDVCTREYWENAIKYMTENVENPLFFVCSDNVDYVLNNLLDSDKYEIITQSKGFSAPVSLAAMSECKHFIIGNTSFGWWAQYLSKNKDKIVIAPVKWMNCEMPIDIYQDKWKLM
ncbi:alpha-1,2-fucosyltransferase [[Clostridium] spiroforme]|nr:alpha-1,2-fucosyltransferase [Thomasclavelia spiroformis]